MRHEERGLGTLQMTPGNAATVLELEESFVTSSRRMKGLACRRDTTRRAPKWCAGVAGADASCAAGADCPSPQAQCLMPRFLLVEEVWLGMQPACVEYPLKMVAQGLLSHKQRAPRD